MPFLTTVIPVYNGECYLREALDSLARQTRRSDRIIVLDDASTDRTPEIAREYAQIGCEVCKNPRNLGLFPNHNRALEFARETDYLHILHANDTLAPGFYEHVMHPLEQIQDCAMAYSLYAVMREDGSLLKPSAVTSIGPANAVPPRHFLASLAEMKALTINAVVMKTDRQPLPCHFRTNLPQVGDVVFHADLAHAFQRIFRIPAPLCFYRLHPGATRYNRKNIQAYVRDEWAAMQHVSSLIPEPPFGKWCRQWRLRGLFACRSWVKIQYAREGPPDFLDEIRSETRRIVGPAVWQASRYMVLLRDLIWYKLAKRKPSDLLVE